MKKRTIEARQTAYRIHPYEMGDYMDLQYALSYKNQYYQWIHKGLVYDEENKTLFVPRGFPDVNLRFKKDCDYKVVRKHNKFNKAIFSLKNEPRDKSQVETIQYLLGIGKHEKTKEHSQLAVDLKTAKGKTYCALAYLKYIKHTGAIICSGLLRQWIERALEHTTLLRSEIYKIKGSRSIEKVLDEDNPKYKLYVMSIETLRSWGKRNGWDTMNPLFQHMGIGTKFYDEAHKNFDTMLKIDAYTNVKKTIYLSFSMKRSDRKENKIFKNAFDHVPFYGRELTTEDDIYLDGLIVKFDSKPDTEAKTYCKTNRGFNAHNYEKRMLWDHTNSKPYFNALEFAVEKVLSNEGKGAFLFSTNNMIKHVKNHLESKYKDIEIGIYTSLVKKKVRHKELDNKIILSTPKSFGEGKDVKNLCFITVCLPYSSPVYMEQIPGRVRPIDGKKQAYMELHDTGFSSIKRQLRRRKKIMKKILNTIYIKTL